MANLTTTAYLSQFVPNYWDTVLGENLYPNLYFYQFGTKRTLPRNFGTSIKIPRLKKQNIVGATTEGTPASTPVCALSGQTISGSLTQFGGVYKHSDILIMTALSDVVELSLIDISRDIARRMDRYVRDRLSATGASISASTAVVTTKLTSSVIAEAVGLLDAQDNPRPPDGHYPTIVHPATIYDLQTNLSGGAWLDINKYTEGNASKIYIGEAGKMYGARFVASSNIRRAFLSAAASGTRAYMFAPDAYYVTEINEMTARTYVKNLGSGGTSDPINQVATVGAKVYFGVVPATWTAAEYRMVRMKYAHGTTRITGSTV